VLELPSSEKLIAILDFVKDLERDFILFAHNEHLLWPIEKELECEVVKEFSKKNEQEHE
jgi:hypothetical protein